MGVAKKTAPQRAERKAIEICKRLEALRQGDREAFNRAMQLLAALEEQERRKKK